MKKNMNPISELKGMVSRKKPEDTISRIEEERKYILSENSDFFIREAYKALRTNMVFSLADEEDCKVIIVTSAMKAEGKSITAVNLAISFAEMNDRVLLIDCDLRRPKLARLMRLRGKTGLSNVLLQPELLGEAIQTSKVPNLDVLTAGDVPPNPSELLGSGKMRRLLEALRKSYDSSFWTPLP